MSERLTYRFGPLERRGILGPIRAGQAAIFGLAALLAIVILDASPNAGGALVAVMLFGSAIVISVAPLARRNVAEWAPVVVAYALRRIVGGARFRSVVPAKSA